MAISNIAIRFTDENYATKSDLSAALGMSSIDSFWVQILAYRSSYQRKIDLKNIHQSQFYATFSPTINQKLNAFIGRLSKLEAKISTISDSNYSQFKLLKTVDCLRNVTYFEGKKIGEMSLRSMVNGTYKESNVDHTSILNYKNALLAFIDKPSIHLSEEFLAKYYSLLIDEEELISFYRTDNLDNTYKYKTTILGKDYSYARAEDIPSLMDDFFAFSDAGGGDPLAKSVMALFYFDYIKPFPSYNRELACIVSKGIISSFGYEKSAGFLHFEELFKDEEKYKKLSLETERSGDLTYLMLYALPILQQGIDETLDLITKIEVDMIESEQYSDIKTPLISKVPNIGNVSHQDKTLTRNQGTLFDTFEDKPKEEQVEKIIKKPEIKTSFEKHPSNQEHANSSIKLQSNTYSQIREPRIKEDKSTLDSKNLAKYILETNPSIKKQQAAFYSTHCELGHYYSIQDYKKANRCVYETARTSMDNLAAEGYYKKIKVKNKFVYTPNKQGDK